MKSITLMEYIIHEAYFPMIQNPPTDQDRTYDLLITEVSFFFPYIYRSNPAYLDTQNLTILEKKKKKKVCLLDLHVQEISTSGTLHLV